MSEPSLNPLLAKVKLPGRVFQLPSRGLFYGPGVLADSVKDGEVQVKPMSALVELKVRSADLLISTKVIREVCAECIPDIKKPELLLSRDVDAIFLFLLASTYGSEKIIKSIHNCEKAEVHDYTINLDPILADPRNKVLDHREVLFSCSLPNGQIVNLKPVTFIDGIDMMLLRQAVSRKEIEQLPITHEEMEAIVVRDMMSVIASVSTGDPGSPPVTDRAKIDEWIRFLSKDYINLIVEAATRAADWGFNYTVKLKCKDCGEEYDHDLELNPVNFFSG